MNELIKETVISLTEKSIIDPDSIPDIELYVDQVTTFIGERLAAYENDKAITKTMVNNYTKAGLINPPVKKKYNKETIEMLIMIFHFKYVLSIDKIRSVSSFVKNRDTEKFYGIFTQAQKDQSVSTTDEMKKIALTEDTDDIFRAVCILTEGAVVRKKLAEKLIEKYISTERAEPHR